MIHCIRRPISLAMALVHFGLSSPFISCLHSWDFPLSGQMKEFIIIVWIVTSPVVLFVCTQSYPVFCTIVLVGTGVGNFLGSGIFVMRLVMILLTFRRLDLVLYLFTSGNLKVLTSYGRVYGGMTSVSSVVMWGSVWGGRHFACPGVISILVLVFTL